MQGAPSRCTAHPSAPDAVVAIPPCSRRTGASFAAAQLPTCNLIFPTPIARTKHLVRPFRLPALASLACTHACGAGPPAGQRHQPAMWSHVPTKLQFHRQDLSPRGGGAAGTGRCVKKARHQSPLVPRQRWPASSSDIHGGASGPSPAGSGCSPCNTTQTHGSLCGIPGVRSLCKAGPTRAQHLHTKSRTTATRMYCSISCPVVQACHAKH